MKIVVFGPDKRTGCCVMARSRARKGVRPLRKTVASWKAEFTPEARRQFERLDRSVQRRIQIYLNENVLAGDPRRFGRALRGDCRGFGAIASATSG